MPYSMLHMFVNKVFDISTINFNQLLAKYNFEVQDISSLNNKIISVDIQGNIYSWQLFSNKHNFLINFIQENNTDILNDKNESKNTTIKSDLIIYIPLSLSLILSINDNNHILSKIKIDGDAHLASKLVKLIQSLNISLEDILALKLPRTLAYMLSQALNKHIATAKYGVNSIIQSTSDYFTYELKQIISITEFSDFEQNNIDLRDNVDRAAQKMQKLIKLIFYKSDY